MTDTVWIEQFQGLSALPENVKQYLVDESKVMHVPAGKAVFGPGAVPDSLLFLLNGRVRVQQTSESGRDIVLYRVEAGESCVLTTACLLAQTLFGRRHYRNRGDGDCDSAQGI